jgi:hypothetical protein
VKGIVIRYVYPSMPENSDMPNRYFIRTTFLTGKFHAEILQQNNFQLTQDELPFSRTAESIVIFTSFHLMPKNVREFPTVITLNMVP